MFDFIQNQIFGMKWLSDFVALTLENFGLDLQDKFASSLHFFIYDTIKITILLCVLIFVISFVQSYFPPERSKRILGHFKGLKAIILAALLGTVTPFCSCSSIPLFIGFCAANIPLEISLAFLISSPMVDLGSLVLLGSIFGMKIAVIYVFLGLLVAVLGGVIIKNLNLENEIKDFVKQSPNLAVNSANLSKKERINFAFLQMKNIFKKVFLWIVLGVAIGAFIHNFIPHEFVQNILGDKNPFGVIIAVLVGAPIYADIFGVIGVAQALYLSGANLGSVLAFMMAVTTLSLPSLILLSKVVSHKLLAIFVAICVFGIILVGYLFNFFENLF